MTSNHHRTCHWRCSVRQRAFPHEPATNKPLIFAADIHQATDVKNNNTSVVTDDHGDSDGSNAATTTIIFTLHVPMVRIVLRHRQHDALLYTVSVSSSVYSEHHYRAGPLIVPPMAIDSYHCTSGRIVRDTEHFLPSHDALSQDWDLQPRLTKL